MENVKMNVSQEYYKEHCKVLIDMYKYLFAKLRYKGLSKLEFAEKDNELMIYGFRYNKDMSLMALNCDKSLHNPISIVETFETKWLNKLTNRNLNFGTKKNSPCFECKERKVGCHSVCVLYKEYQRS